MAGMLASSTILFRRGLLRPAAAEIWSGASGSLRFGLQCFTTNKGLLAVAYLLFLHLVFVSAQRFGPF